MIPEALEALERETLEHGFSMASERRTGRLLRSLAATKPGGRLLELGTGTGMATAWLLDGMGEGATLDTVDNDPSVLAIARRHLGADERLTIHECDGAEFIVGASRATYDLIFADAWPGKYSHLDEAIALLRTGGIYFIDDMSRQPNWPEGHERHVERLLRELEARSDLKACQLDFSTGIVLCARAS